MALPEIGKLRFD